MKRIALKITLFYSLFGFTWILVSDQFIHYFFEHETEVVLQSFKGIIYVIISGALIWGLLKYYIEKLEKVNSAFDETFKKTLSLWLFTMPKL